MPSHQRIPSRSQTQASYQNDIPERTPPSHLPLRSRRTPDPPTLTPRTRQALTHPAHKISTGSEPPPTHPFPFLPVKQQRPRRTVRPAREARFAEALPCAEERAYTDAPSGCQRPNSEKTRSFRAAVGEYEQALRLSHFPARPTSSNIRNGAACRDGPEDGSPAPPWRPRRSHTGSA